MMRANLITCNVGRESSMTTDQLDQMTCAVAREPYRVLCKDGLTSSGRRCRARMSSSDRLSYRQA